MLDQCKWINVYGYPVLVMFFEINDFYTYTLNGAAKSAIGGIVCILLEIEIQLIHAVQYQS